MDKDGITFRRYVRERWKTLGILLAAIGTVEVFLFLYSVEIWFHLYTALVIFAGYGIGLYTEYRPRARFYRRAVEVQGSLDEKYLIAEVMQQADTMEEEAVKEILTACDKSMLEHVNHYRQLQTEYKEYIELWIHEIKLPIATGKMIIENNRSDVTERIGAELDEIENYTEQALYYARSSYVNRDYYVTRCSLHKIINAAIRKNKQQMIRSGIRIEQEDIDQYIYSDEKWCTFILHQILQNSVKYSCGQNACIQFIGKRERECVVLRICDNGIGIKEGEVGRVFDKGFTGTNGRRGKKSTGIGLYLCRKLCDRLGIGIELQSKEQEGTTVILSFPQNSMLQMH